jgi:penicillin-binding protein 2
MGRFGFGADTGIDTLGESAGIMPSRAWKAAHDRNPWFPGETIIAGIGQGYWAVTPLQLAHALATLADHGVAHAPRLVMATRSAGEERPTPLVNPPSGPSLIKDPKDWNVIDEGMRAVMTAGTGRGLNAGFPYAIAGKSGTAERYSRTTDAYDTNKNTTYLATRHRAWFVAYAPADNPQIAIAVLLEAGAWGAADAGPIVRRMLDVWLNLHGGSLIGAQRLQDAATLSGPVRAPAGQPAQPVARPADTARVQPQMAAGGAQP